MFNEAGRGSLHRVEMPSGNPTSSPSRASAVALGSWLAIQLITIAVSAARWPLWARAPFTGERLALAAVLVAQVASASMLFPYLLSTVRSTVLALASAAAMGALAGNLADSGAPQMLLGEGYVAVWLIVL